MNENQTPVIWTVIIAAFFIIVAVVVSGVSIGNKIGDGLDLMNAGLVGLDVDEQAIANAIIAGIVMPTMPEWTAPEMPDTAKLNELWDEAYGPQVETLEDDAEEEFGEQFLDDNDRGVGNWFVKYDNFTEDSEIYELVTDGVDCDGDCVVQYVKEYKDDYEITVINLGLDDEDDREVTIVAKIRVKVFTDEDDLDEYFFERVDINSVVTSDDGDLEAEVNYSL